MALRRSSSGRYPRNDEDLDEEEVENNGYVQVFVKPLDSGSYNMILGWLGLGNIKLTQQQVTVAYTVAGVVAAVILYQVLFSDLGYLFHRICSLIIPIFSVGCAFYCIALYLRKTWSTTSIYILFCACFAGEFIGQCLCDNSKENYITQPLLSLVVLVSVSFASVFSTLETVNSTGLIVFVSFIRFLACTSLVDLPQTLRPFVAYFSGVAGVIAAKYMETVFKPPSGGNGFMTPDGKIPVIKRRRSSSSTAQSGSFSRHASRRTSLPALIHSKQVSPFLRVAILEMGWDSCGPLLLILSSLYIARQ